MFAAICVTLHAVLEIGDAFFAMFANNIGFGVLVAAIAGVGCVIGWMAGYARDCSLLAMIQRESVIARECGWCPCGCSVAGNTVYAELTEMLNWLGMAGNAGRLRADKYIVEVAIFAIDGNVRSREREIAQVVIEGYSVPIFRSMTGFTLSSELSLMFIILIMAGVAILRCRLQIYNAASIEMAAGAGGFYVAANQLKLKGVVIEALTISVNAIVTGKTL